MKAQTRLPAGEDAPIPDRVRWWTEGRFGCSFHWGLYSIPARGEWVRSAERLTIEQYQRYFDAFNPDRYDARAWARLLKQAGFKYAALTTKHHDGFCLFDSQLTQYKATNTPARRDLVREFVDAMRAEGLRVGLYYSLVDWHHADYPAWGDRQHPMREKTEYRDRAHDWSNYIRYFHGQVRELLTNYGKIDLMLFDFSYPPYLGEKWGASELVKMIRSIQPDIVLNDRLGTGQAGNIKEATPPAYAGDFDSCELNTPMFPITNAQGQRVPWDLWITHNNSWCYNGTDPAYKPADSIIRTLVNCVSKGGNLTFNLSPDARGQIPRQSVETLEEVGRWMSANGESIYGCGVAPFEQPDWGRFTMSNDGRRLYAHIMEQPMGHLTMPGLRGKIANPRIVATGAEAYLGDFWNSPVQSFGRAEDVFFGLHKPIHQTYILPDRIDTVVRFDLV
jgi:alpha-L-fucosidase